MAIVPVARPPLPAQSGIELGYADRTTNFTAAAIAQEDVPSLSLTITEGSRPYYLEFSAYLLRGSTSGEAVYALITDSTNVILATAAVLTPAPNRGYATNCRARIPTPGTPGASKTYKVRTLGTGACIPTIEASAGARALLTAIEA